MMRNRPRTLRIIVSLCASAMLGACDSLGIKADAGYGSFALSGDVGLSPGGFTTPVPVDMESEVGLGQRMGTPYARVEADFWIVSATFSGFAINQQGGGRLSQFFGTIPAGTTVTTDIDIKNAKAAVYFDLFDFDVVRISSGIGLDVFDLDLQTQATLGAITVNERVNAIAPVPMLFLQGEVDIGMAEIVLDIGGMYADIADANGKFIDVELFCRIEPVDHVHLFAGYRHIVLDVEGIAENQAFSGDIQLSGFMFGGGIRF